MEDFELPESNHLQAILNKSDFFVITANFGNEVVGGLTVYTLSQYYSPKPLAFIYDRGIA